MNGDELLFADEVTDSLEEVQPQGSPLPPWKLLVVDDDAEVHRATRLVMTDYEFLGRNVELFSAFSAEEGMKLMQEHPDVAVVLLDVVMETNQAGLHMVKRIREDLGNKLVRIILRTGEPGEAPEQHVIVEYDINDYKEKSELTARKLYTAVTTALRSYRDLKNIETSRRGLREILDASSDLFVARSIKQLASGVLTQLTSILGVNDNSMYLNSSGLTLETDGNEMQIIAASGKFAECVEGSLTSCAFVTDVMSQRIQDSYKERQNKFYNDAWVGSFPGTGSMQNIVYLEGDKRTLEDMDVNLINIFSTNVALALNNLRLHEEIVDTQREMILRLSEVVEARSKETAFHVRRVAEFTRILALASGLNEEESNLMMLASPMHDVGKIGIPDAVLLKPGKLTADEFELIKSHTLIGYDILKGSVRPIMRMAAEIALNHHERWDGNGYPNKLKEDEIPLSGRITMVCDVFDALASDRVYKKAWELSRVITYMSDNAGTQFDPTLVRLLNENMDQILAIREKYTN